MLRPCRSFSPVSIQPARGGFSIRLCPVWTDKASGNDRLPVARPVFPEPRSCPDGKSVTRSCREPAVRFLRQHPVSSGPRRKEIRGRFGDGLVVRVVMRLPPRCLVFSGCVRHDGRATVFCSGSVRPVFLSPSLGPSCRFFRRAERKTHIRPLPPVSGRIPSREDRRRYRAR